MGKIWKKIQLKLPKITTLEKEYELIKQVQKHTERIERKSVWSAINPVILDLEKLRANTWDQDRIDKIRDWLICNFEF